MFRKLTRRTAWVLSALVVLAMVIAPAHAATDDPVRPVGAKPPTMLAATALPPIGSNADGWSAVLWQDHYVENGKSDLYLVSPSNGYYRVATVPAISRVAAVAPDASKIVLLDEWGNGMVHVWDARSRTQTQFDTSAFFLEAVRFTYPTGRNLLLTAGDVGIGYYTTRTTLTGERLSTVRVGQNPSVLQSVNGEKQVFGNEVEPSGISVANNATGVVERTVLPPTPMAGCWANRSLDASNVIATCREYVGGVNRVGGIFSVPTGGGAMKTLVPPA